MFMLVLIIATTMQVVGYALRCVYPSNTVVGRWC